MSLVDCCILQQEVVTRSYLGYISLLSIRTCEVNQMLILSIQGTFLSYVLPQNMRYLRPKLKYIFFFLVNTKRSLNYMYKSKLIL